MSDGETLFEYRRRRMRELADAIGYDRDKALKMYHDDVNQRAVAPENRLVVEWLYPKCPECSRPVSHKSGCKLSGRLSLKPRRKR